MIRSGWGVILITVFFMVGTAAGEKSASSLPEAKPLTIQADSLQVDNLAQTVTFTGHVRAEYATAIIHCERIKAIYDKDKKRLKNVEIQGKIRIEQGDRIVAGEEATFDQDLSKITITGAPVRISEGKQWIEGRRVVVDLISQKGQIEGEVKGVFFPPEKEKLNAPRLPGITP